MQTIIRPDYTPRLVDAHPTPRLRADRGRLTVAVLHNRKHNADVLLGRLAENLAADLGGSVVSITGKDHAAIPAPEALVAQAATAHVVLTGSAD
jgi:hypothetical protein